MKRIVVLLLLLLPALLYSQNRYDVVISEIMADPSPQVGLPNVEWIELKNVSTSPINLQGWRIGDAAGQSGPMPTITLQPDSFIVICAGSAVQAMSAFGRTISVTSFPALNNDADQLYIRSASGMIIHAVSYTDEWYENEIKKDGGWTLEMIDPKLPCAGINNWKASKSSTGGTPGGKNSIDENNIDATSPVLKRAYTTDSVTIMLVYDESLDSLSAADILNYTIEGGPAIASASTLPPLFNIVQLKTNIPLAQNIIYRIIASHVKDCSGNIIAPVSKVKVGLPAEPVAGDWIINEILFDPKPNSFDYVEFLNSSNKILDASKLYIANRNSSGVISSIKILSETPWLIFPGDHIVVTEDADNLALNYLVSNPDHALRILSLPSLPDQEGYVVALNHRGEVLDEVHYKDDWHFKLIDNPQGVSLERIDPAAASNDPTNWHSAASTAGYGTPTYKNSQYKLLSSITATIEVTPKIFSPDNDGRDDVAIIQYKATEPGYVANVIIYDTGGRQVKTLVRNGVLGLSGFWQWDGLDDKGLKLPVGHYIIYVELFNLKGKKELFKKTIVLARKLR